MFIDVTNVKQALVRIQLGEHCTPKGSPGDLVVTVRGHMEKPAELLRADEIPGRPLRLVGDSKRDIATIGSYVYRNLDMPLAQDSEGPPVVEIFLPADIEPGRVAIFLAGGGDVSIDGGGKLGLLLATKLWGGNVTAKRLLSTPSTFLFKDGTFDIQVTGSTSGCNGRLKLELKGDASGTIDATDAGRLGVDVGSADIERLNLIGVDAYRWIDRSRVKVSTPHYGANAPTPPHRLLPPSGFDFDF